MRGIFFMLLLSLIAPFTADGKVLSREEALNAAFPGAIIQSSIIFLTEVQKKEIAKIAGAPVETALVAKYTATINGKSSGRAYLDTHVVRTKKQSVLVILNAEGKVKRVEVVAFLEPPEYIPSDRWYAQFEEKTLTDRLQLDADIHSVTGATLTAKATTAAVRRALAIDQVLHGAEKQP